MLKEDYELSREDIQGLSTRDAIAAFFAKLGYNTNERLLQNVAAMGFGSELLKSAITSIERLASEDGGLLEVYLVELKSVTVAVTRALAQAFRNLSVLHPLLVLTDDYQRLDFVLVERYTASNFQESTIPGFPAPLTRQVGVRPRVLTINRLKPGDVELRVLRRFSYTESDSLAQYDKLLSAYDVADWSEPFFNNRALFSDYFLIQRLPESPDWKDPVEAAAMTRAYRTLRDLYADVRETFANQPGTTVRTNLLAPTLQALGFTVEPTRADHQDTIEPDYRLSVMPNTGPLAFCLAYPWGRNLDGKDDQRDSETPDENPGAVVVSLLDRGDVDWAIVTNGKLWRLYSAKAHSRATNYYEIDLEETLAQPPEHRELAFRYFWYFFRATAFLPTTRTVDGETRQICFIDSLVSESERYARELGQRLKDRVFFEIFPHFARGFILHARRTNQLPAGLDTLPDEERSRLLEPFFSGTLTFLYRLLFLLYAESRDLLPVREVRGYYEKSLEKLKDEIAEQAQAIEDAAPVRLKDAYNELSTACYDRLQQLFQAVDKGEAELNVPVYNGGLFVTRPDEDDTTPEANVARFLATHKIPDRQLALGLDLMARNRDDKTFALAMIDYKSLGVRQLGSIYEGLLEFKLRVAPEEMVVVKGKKTEEIVPYAEAQQQKLAIVKEGRGKEARDKTHPKGYVYLENDRRERKATGSYYTPDYIVKYIVEHTVGPVLQAKLEALRPLFREAEQTLRAKRSKHEALQKQRLLTKGDDPERETYHHYRETLGEAFFDLKVLDPAMGSGHFLVEAVDYITDQMAKFLTAFKWNPVVYGLAETRRDIQQEMERQGVTIDMSKLTDLNLLKRSVLKRCIYGVDLNPMAVELAKVSLWLDCFTLGAPLSFLDHHMKPGNSLIGAQVEEAREAVEEGQLSLFFGSTLWASASLATEGALEVAKLSDVTAHQVLLSKEKHRDAEKALAPYKRLLDVYLSRWFGNTIVKGKAGKADIDKALDFLRSPEAQVWYQHPNRTGILNNEQQTVVNITSKAAQAHHFFHWEMEFPEVFFGRVVGTTQAIELKKDSGFDVVIGNPPYDVLSEKERQENLTEIMSFFESASDLKPALGRKLDLYRLFLVQGSHIVRPNGFLSFIIPMSLLCDQQTENLRNYCLENLTITRIDAFPQKDDPNRRVFYEAKLATCIPVIKKSRHTSDSLLLIIHPGKLMEEIEGVSHINYQQLREIISCTGGIPLVRQDAEFSLLSRLYTNPVFDLLGKHLVTYQGEINETTHIGFLSEDPSTGPLVYRGSNVQRYDFVNEAKQGRELYINEKAFQARFNQGKVAHTTLKRYGYQRKAALDNWRRLIFGPIPYPSYCFESISYFLDEGVKSLFFLAILDSHLMEWRFGLTSTNNMVSTDEIASLPVRRINFITSDKERAYYLEKAKNLYEYCLSKGDQQCVLGFVEHHLSKEPEESDVVHDLLALLAEEMMRLNKEKRAATREFLDWLVTTLHIVPDKDGRKGIDALTGKSKLLDYPGDYQKGESPLATADLLEILQKNRGRLGVSLSDTILVDKLRKVYEESLQRVLPLKEQLAKTDRLIDAVVYRLYGLTEEDMQVVEGRE